VIVGYEYDNLVVNQLMQSVKTGVTTILDSSFVVKYAEMAYQKGINRAYTDSNKAKPKAWNKIKSLDDYKAGNKDAFLDMIQSDQKSNQTKASMIATFTSSFNASYTKLQVSIEEMLVLMTNDRKSSPEMIKDAVLAMVSKYSNYAKTSAHDLLSKSHAEAELDAFEKLGIHEVVAVAEWQTIGDEKVCKACSKHSGQRIPIAKARGLIPMHPNCRCAWITPELATHLTPKEKTQRSNETVQGTDNRLKSTVTESETAVRDLQAEIKSYLTEAKKESVRSGFKVDAIVKSDTKYAQLNKSLEDKQFNELKAKAAMADYRDTLISGRSILLKKRVENMVEELLKLEEAGAPPYSIGNRSPREVAAQWKVMIKEHKFLIDRAYEILDESQKFIEQIPSKRNKFRKYLESGDFSRYNNGNHPAVTEYITELLQIS
jgi:hypothetical protein